MGSKENIQFANNQAEKLLRNFPPSLNKLGRMFGKRLNVLRKHNKLKKNDLKKLDKLYGVMNKYSNFISSYTPCKKNCSKCCYIRVDISEIEILYIEKKYKIKRNENLKPNTDGAGTPCCFLKDGACSIYEGRPYVCRRTFTFAPDDKWCDYKSDDLELPTIPFQEVEFSYLFLSGGFNKYDIRDVFGGR